MNYENQNILWCHMVSYGVMTPMTNPFAGGVLWCHGMGVVVQSTTPLHDTTDGKGCDRHDTEPIF